MKAQVLLERMVAGAKRWTKDDKLQWADGIVREHSEPYFERNQLVQTIVDDEGICWRVTVQRVN
jgi:hypothetical protein